MMYRLFCLVILFSCFSSFAQTINIGAAEWEEFTNKDGSGIYFDLIRKIYANEKLSIKMDSYNRVINQFDNGKLDMVIGIYRGDVKKGILPQWYLDTENPIIAIYDPKTTQLDHAADLELLTASWIRGYQFERLIPEVDSPYLINAFDDGIKLLENGRIDVLIDYAYNLSSNHLEYKTLKLTPAQHLYIAFQRNKNGQMLANRWDSEMTRLRKSGELANIYGEYYEKSNLSQYNTNKKNVVIITQNSNLLNRKKNDTRSSIEAKILNLVTDKLQYHQLEPKLLRTYLDIEKYKDTPSTCFSNMLKNKEREQHFIFSQPMAMYLGLRLYSKFQLAIKEPIDLVKLMSSNTQYQLGIAPGQSYGIFLDQKIVQVKSRQIVNIPAKTTTTLKALKAGHVSFLLGYPTVIERGIEQTKVKELFSYQIAGIDKFIVSHMMCSRSVSSEMFINEFNEILSDLYQNGRYFSSLYEDVSQPEKKAFRKQYKRMLKGDFSRE